MSQTLEQQTSEVHVLLSSVGPGLSAVIAQPPPHTHTLLSLLPPYQAGHLSGTWHTGPFSSAPHKMLTSDTGDTQDREQRGSHCFRKTYG